jgi:hypothetical protein
MGLLANGSPLHTSPLRYLGAADARVLMPANWYRRGALNNFYAGEATVVGGASVANKSAFPEGYLHPISWVLPIKPGGMASRGRISGTGDVTAANLAGGLNGEAALTGDGDITDAALALIVSAVAALTGDATLAADITGKLEASADLTGSSTVAAAIAALTDLVAVLTGSSTLSADIVAKGSMSADIVVTGELLSTANVGSAVWQYLIEAGFSAEEILRIVAAANAGVSSGFPAAPGTGVFRDLSDTKDRITATLDGDGNRTSIVYDPS